MLRFKEFLTERKRMSPSTKNWLKFQVSPYKKWLHPGVYPLPISRPMMRRLNLSETEAKGLHITNIEGMKNLISNQNSARQIAVMTWISSINEAESLFKGGVATDGGVACLVHGEMSLKVDWDVYSHVDKQGRRWIDLDLLSHDKGYAFDQFLGLYTNMMDDVISAVGRKYIPKVVPDLVKAGWPLASLKAINFDPKRIIGDKDYTRDFWVEGQKFIERNTAPPRPGEINLYPITKRHPVVKLFNKGLAELTKGLFDGAEKFLAKNISYVETLLKTASDGSSYNEGLMSDYDIKEIRFDVEAATGEYPLHWAEELGIPFEFEEGTIAGLDPEVPADSRKLEELFSKHIKKLAKGIKIYSTTDKNIDSFFRKFIKKG